MMKPHRRAGWLVAFLVGMSLVAGVRDGMAYGPFRWPEPPGPPQIGDPDTPPSVVRNSVGLEGFWRMRLVLVVGRVFVMPRVEGDQLSPTRTKRVPRGISGR